MSLKYEPSSEPVADAQLHARFQMCSGSEAGSYLRLIDFPLQSPTLNYTHGTAHWSEEEEGSIVMYLTKSNIGSEEYVLQFQVTSNSCGARPVHLIITMIKWIRTSRLSMKNSFSNTLEWDRLRTRGYRRTASRSRFRQTGVSTSPSLSTYASASNDRLRTRRCRRTASRSRFRQTVTPPYLLLCYSQA